MNDLDIEISLMILMEEQQFLSSIDSHLLSIKSSYNYQGESSRSRYSPSRYSSSSSDYGNLRTDISDKFKNNPNSAAYQGGGRCSRTSHNDYYSRGPVSTSSRGGGRYSRNSEPTYKVGPPQLWNSRVTLSKAAQDRVREREGQNTQASRTRSWGEHTTPMSRFYASNTFPVPGTPPRSNPFL